MTIGGRLAAASIMAVLRALMTGNPRSRILLARQHHAALGQQQHQVRGLEHLLVGHQLPQMPVVANLLDHGVLSLAVAQKDGRARLLEPDPQRRPGRVSPSSVESAPHR